MQFIKCQGKDKRKHLHNEIYHVIVPAHTYIYQTQHFTTKYMCMIYVLPPRYKEMAKPIMIIVPAFYL